MLLKAEGPEELATIAAAVDAAYANDSSLRRLRFFRELLSGARRPQPGDLADRLSPPGHRKHIVLNQPVHSGDADR